MNCKIKLQKNLPFNAAIQQERLIAFYLRENSLESEKTRTHPEKSQGAFLSV